MPSKSIHRSTRLARFRAGGAAVLAAAALLTASCSNAQAGPPPPPRPLAVRTVEVRTGPMRESLRYVGTVASRREVQVRARLSGTVEALPREAGERAAEGDLLARIGSPEHQARVSRLVAELRRADTEATYLCDRHETDARLAAQGVMAPAEADASRRACAGATAARAAASAGLREARSLSEKAVERAPFDGRVLHRHAEPGAHLSPGQPLLTFGGEALEVRVQVAEADLARGIAVGTPVRLFGAEERGAEVSWVGALARGPARTVEVKVSLPPTGASPPPHGSSVDVAFVLAEEPGATAVPRDAVAGPPEDAFVFVVREGRLARLPVTTGIEAGGWVAIRPALPAGTRVAVGDPDRLSDGATVYAVAAREVTP